MILSTFYIVLCLITQKKVGIGDVNMVNENNSNMLPPKWYYCKRHKHWWTDRPGIDHGMPTGFNKGEKDCATNSKMLSRGTYT